MSTHVAGPELDRLVAEKVMGWEPVSSGLRMRGSPPDLWLCKGGRRRVMRAWNPSTNIAQAWEVVERCRSLGHRVTLQLDGAWRVWINGGLPSEDDTAPLAICFAALAAVGGEP